jgi:uncharacterized protein
MDVLQEDNNHKGRFYILHENEVAAEMTYTWAGRDKIIIDHTGVDESLKGKNAGKKMLLQLIDFARNRQLKVIPLCPFANSMFKKMSEIRDVL